MKEQKHYAERDAIALGKFYTAHVSAMAREKLFAKSDIAAELACRDKVIASYRDKFIADYPVGGDMNTHKLVPVKPTEEMIHAGQMLRGCFPRDVLDFWQAMLAAAPEVEQEPYAYEYGVSNGDGTFSVVIDKGKFTQLDENEYGYCHPGISASKEWPVTPLYLHPQPAPEVEPTHKDKIIAEHKHEFSMGVCYAAAEIAEENPVVASELLKNAGLFRKKAIEIGVDDFDFRRIDEANAWPKGDEK